MESIIMNKIKIMIVVLFCSQLSLAMEVQSVPKEVWRGHFKTLPHQKYNKAAGYDLKITLWPDNRKEVEHKNISILAHGWGSSPVTPVEGARLVGPHRIPGDLITFRFK